MYLRFLQWACQLSMVAAAAVGWCDGEDGTHHVTLRDLTIVEAAAVSFDEHGVSADGRIFGWDQIHSGRVGDDRQADFDRRLLEIGLPMFRIRHRLSIRDWNPLAEIVEPIYSQQAETAVTDANRRTKYLLSLAAFRSRLAVGRPADALLPFIETCRIGRDQRGGETFRIPEIATSEPTAAEIGDHFTTELLPIWFDAEAAKRNLGPLQKFIGKDLKTTADGILIYSASLAIAASESETATANLKELSTRTSELATAWLPILRVELENKTGVRGPATVALQNARRNLDGPIRALANYLLASQTGDLPDDIDAAILDLLTIPANFVTSQRELSAAALHHAALLATKAGRLDEAAILKSELHNHYQSTYHGGLQIAK